MQLDFILEMHSQDNPENTTFIRAGQIKTLQPAEMAAAWERVLVGNANDEMMRKLVPSEAVMARLRNEHKYMKPTIKMGQGSK